MFGLLLIAFGSIVGEVGTSIGKYEVQKKKAGIYTMGFMNLIWGAVLLLITSFFLKDGLRFSVASLPTVSIRVVFGILQLHFTLKAITQADRSTFGFLRILTIPLLLGVDIFLGYRISFGQTLGIGLIVISLLYLFLNHGIEKKGARYVLLSAVGAVITISLYKYNIANFNSVAAEQIIAYLTLVVYLLFMTTVVEKVNPFSFLKKKAFLVESVSMGVAGVLVSFAYMFGAASVITTAKRALVILISTISGKTVFKEKNLLIKLVAFLIITIGLVLLVT